jgi:DNA-binding transcriptional LysR family regulator
VVQAGNITEAASRLNISQPPLSYQLKKLEAELGVKLFERGSRRIRLTSAGQLLNERAEFILEFINKTATEVKEFELGLTGTLSLGSISTIGANIMPKIIPCFNERFPRITFQLWEGNGDRITNLLKTRMIEIGIIRLPFDNNFFDSYFLFKEPLVFVINSKKYPELAKMAKIPLIHVERVPLIVPRRWSSNFISECMQKGFLPKIISKSDASMQDILWAQTGMAIAVLPASAAAIIKNNNLVYKKIADLQFPIQAAVVWERGRNISVVAKNFIEMVKGYCARRHKKVN